MAAPCSTLANCQAKVSHERASEQGLIIAMAVLSLVVGVTLLVFACTRPWGIFFFSLSRQRGEPQHADDFGLGDLERQASCAPSSTVLWDADDDMADDAAWSVAGAGDPEWEEVAVYGGSSAVMRVPAEAALETGISSGLTQMPFLARSPPPAPSATGVKTRSGPSSLGSFRRRAFSDSQVRRWSSEHPSARYNSLELYL